MTYKPPFARMRQIRRDAPSPVSRSVPNVEAALAQRTETVFVVEEPVAPVEDPTPAEVKPEAPVVPGEMEPEEPKQDPPKFHPQMKKSDLLSVARTMGLAVDDGFTKAQILNALKAAVGQ